MSDQKGFTYEEGIGKGVTPDVLFTSLLIAGQINRDAEHLSRAVASNPTMTIIRSDTGTTQRDRWIASIKNRRAAIARGEIKKFVIKVDTYNKNIEEREKIQELADMQDLAKQYGLGVYETESLDDIEDADHLDGIFWIPLN